MDKLPQYFEHIGKFLVKNNAKSALKNFTYATHFNMYIHITCYSIENFRREISWQITGNKGEKRHNMTKPSVPLFGERPALDQTCGRLVPGGHCNKQATVHMLWNEEGDNGLCCYEHTIEANCSWSIIDQHPITAVCTLPDANWFYSWDEPPGCCKWVVSEETMALTREEEYSGGMA